MKNNYKIGDQVFITGTSIRNICDLDKNGDRFWTIKYPYKPQGLFLVTIENRSVVLFDFEMIPIYVVK